MSVVRVYGGSWRKQLERIGTGPARSRPRAPSKTGHQNPPAFAAATGLDRAFCQELSCVGTQRFRNLLGFDSSGCERQDARQPRHSCIPVDAAREPGR